MPTPSDNYIIARDASEAERLDLQHRLTIDCQGYYLHPNIPAPTTGTRIADVATGSAALLRDLAPAFPTAELHGFDISDRMFPRDPPKNVQLHVADATQPFESRWLGYFDVVHIRLIMAAMTRDSWDGVMRNLVAILKSGGWLQWVEDDGAHAVRRTVRRAAPPDAAKESLTKTPSFIPPRLENLARHNRVLMDEAKAETMTFGYMNLDLLMIDPTIGDLEEVAQDVFLIDRDDDGGQLRREFATMGIPAVLSFMKSRKDSGYSYVDLSQNNIQDMLKDVELGAYFACRCGVFIGRKKA